MVLSFLAVTGGVLLVVSVLADMVNTLVTTSTSRRRFWLTNVFYRYSWAGMRWLAGRVRGDDRRERLLATYAPVSILVLLIIWVGQQIVGFGLIWWGVGGVEGAFGLGDSLYFSGVVFFTVGFGELVPGAVVPRAGALVEAFTGVLTTALVIGYLPSLYGAYAERERFLVTIDDGSEDRITPTSLVLSRARDGDTSELLAFFSRCEEWVASLLETHGSFPMLQQFRSKHPGQSWITALGLVSDAALHCQIIRDTQNRSPYWMLRRAITLFDQLTLDADLTPYQEQLDANRADVGNQLFVDLHRELEAHGFDVLPLAEAQAVAGELRARYAAALEYLIDELLAPRGFWGHTIGQRLAHPPHEIAEPGGP